MVVELKRDRLHRERLTQATDYASSIGLMPSGQLRERLQPYITGNPDLTDLVDRTLDEEGEGPRQVAIVLAGTRVDPHLEWMAEFLTNHDGFPLAIVTFDVYRSERETVLTREVIEEAPAADSSRRTLSLETIVEKAEKAGVGEQFRRAVAISEAAGLYMRPYVRGVMIAPPQHHNRALLWFRPIPGGNMNVYHTPDGFAEFFPPLTQPPTWKRCWVRNEVDSSTNLASPTA